MLRANQPALQVFRDGEWRFVFCHNPQTGIVFTSDRRKALEAEYHLEWFRNHYGNDQFRADK